MEKKCNYVATYIICNHKDELEAYDVYKKEYGNCVLQKTKKESIEMFLSDKPNIVNLLEQGNMMQISSCYFGVRIQVGMLSKKFQTDMPIFKIVFEEVGDNIFKTLQKLDNRIGSMVYSNKLGYQKTIGGIYE